MKIALLSCVLNYRTIDGLLSRNKVSYLISEGEKELLKREMRLLQYGVNLNPVYLKKPVLLSSFLESLKLVRNNEADLLLTTSPVRGLICLFHKIFFKKPYVIFVGQPFTEYMLEESPIYARLISPFYKILMHISFSQADFILAHSKYLRNYVKKYGAKRVLGVYYYGVDTEAFKPMETKPRKSYTIFCASRFSPQKGVDYLVEACRMMKEKGLEFQVEWYSEGPMKEQVIERSRIENLGINVHSYVDQKTLIERINDSDVFVVPSVSEGLGFAAAEALACGKPIVATNVGGLPDIVEGYGLLVPPRNAKALADALIKVRSELDYYNKKALEGRQHIVKEFERKTVVKKFLDALDEVKNKYSK